MVLDALANFLACPNFCYQHILFFTYNNNISNDTVDFILIQFHQGLAGKTL